MGRISPAGYASQPWRIHPLAADFTVEDVWRFRTPGAGADDFPTMLAAMRKAEGAHPSPVVSFLMGLRWKMGALLGWDQPGQGVGTRVTSIRERLPADLRDVERGKENPRFPLKPVYELEREAVREIANSTVHALMHLGWVQSETSDYELRMAVLVKPNGWLGRLYMAAIAPFRYLLVYPALTRQWERAWLERDRAEVSR